MTTSLKIVNKHGDTRGLDPKSLANLHPNLNGRPPNPFCITTRAKEKLPEVCPFDAQGRTWGEVLPEAMLRHALIRTDGMKELLDRTEGKVPEKHAILGDIVIEVVYVDRRKAENNNTD